MARRNRKKRKVNGYMFPVPFAGVAVLVCALALGYVWLGCQCEALGEEIKVLESTRAELNKQYLNASYRWARTKSPQSLEIALERHGLEMDWPRANQVVRLVPGSGMSPDLAEDLRRGVKVAAVRRRFLHE